MQLTAYIGRLYAQCLWGDIWNSRTQSAGNDGLLRMKSMINIIVAVMLDTHNQNACYAVILYGYSLNKVNNYDYSLCRQRCT